MYCSAHRRKEHSHSRALTSLTLRTKSVKLVTAAMVSPRCTLVEILTPIKLPNSYSIFGLIAAAGGASRTRAGAYVDEMEERRPMPERAGRLRRGGRESYNFKRSTAVDSL
jgi:hypothetical protein